LLLLADYTKNF